MLIVTNYTQVLGEVSIIKKIIGFIQTNTVNFLSVQILMKIHKIFNHSHTL